MKDNYESRFKEAEMLYIQGDYSEALYRFKMIESYRYNNDLSNYIGCCFLNLGEYEKAEKVFTFLLSNVSNWERPWFNLGRVHLATKKYKEAYLCFETALKINHASSDANFYMATYYENTNNLIKAIDFYKISVELENTIECHFNLSRCYQSLGNSDLAMTHAIYAYNIDNYDIDAVFNLSLLLIKEKKYTEAYQILCLDIFKNSSDLGVLKNLLFSSIKVCDFQTADIVAKKIISIEPLNHLALDFLTNQGTNKTGDGSLS